MQEARVYIQSRASTSSAKDTPALLSQITRERKHKKQGRAECASPIRATCQTPSQKPADSPMHVWSTHQPPATFSSRGRRTLTFSSVCAAAWGRNAAARRVGRSAARAWPCRALCGAASAWPSTAERACIPVVFMLAVYVSGAADPCMFYAYMPAKSVCRQSFARSRKTYKPKYDEIYIYIGKGSLPLCLPKKKKASAITARMHRMQHDFPHAHHWEHVQKACAFDAGCTSLQPHLPYQQQRAFLQPAYYTSA